jgi:predicted dehydrogenase
MDWKRRDILESAGALMAGAALLPGAMAASAGDNLTVGCIGVGNRGSAHLKNLLQIPGVVVGAICDNDPVHLEKAQARVVEAGKPKPTGYADWKKMLERKDVGVVVSAIPCDLHAPCYLDVIASGKDLYAEKPLALTIPDTDAVVAAANKSSAIVQVGLQRRIDPLYISCVRRVHEGEIGELIEGRIIWSNAWGPFGGWYGLRARSGDWMVEQAVHVWDVINWASRSRPVCAMGMGRSDLFQNTSMLVDNVCKIKEVPAKRDVTDYYSGVMQFESGLIVNIIHCWTAPKHFGEEYTRLIGTRGGVEFDSGLFSYRSGVGVPEGSAAPKSRTNQDMDAMQAFLQSVRTRKPPIVNVEHGRDAVLTCLLMREAVYRKKMVTMKELTA